MERKWEFMNSLEAVKAIENRALALFEKAKLEQNEVDNCYFAFKEAVSNAYKASPKNAVVKVEIVISPQAVIMTVENEGKRFDPEPYFTLNFEDHLGDEGGRGIALISKLTFAAFVFESNRVILKMLYLR